LTLGDCGCFEKNCVEMLGVGVGVCNSIHHPADACVLCLLQSTLLLFHHGPCPTEHCEEGCS
jgi:hypothetical protein